jgi:malonate-semialdehyde dehydrogenase (acetylating) / methylmalonate-semialdehyde dehydrogenase
MALTTTVFVGEAQEWIPEITEKVKKLKMGAGFDQGVDIGPLCYPEVKNNQKLKKNNKRL